MMTLRLALLIVLVSACTSEPAARSDSVAVVAPDPAGQPAVVPPPDTAPPTTGTPPANPTPAPWTATEFGLGPLRAGMTIPEAARTVGGSFAAPSEGAASCSYAVWPGRPEGVLVMLDKNRVARVEITKGSIATSRGARIGDSEARIKELYPGRVVVTPHEYTDGHYLTVTPAAGSGDRNYRLVFETDGSRVLRYRGGVMPNVEYVEGCS